MNANEVSNLPNQSWRKLMLHWVIVLICSLMLPFGIMYVLGSIFSLRGENSFQPGWFALGVSLVFGSPLLLGLYFRPTWRGFLSSFLAMVWVFVLSGSYLMRLIYVPDIILLPFYILVVAGEAAIILIVSERVKTKTDFAGLSLGLVIGCLLAFLAFSVLPNRWWGLGPIIPAIPAIILSAVLFPEVLSRRAGWLSILIVGVMLVITIFIVVLGP